MNRQDLVNDIRTVLKKYHVRFEDLPNSTRDLIVRMTVKVEDFIDEKWKDLGIK